MAGGVESSRSQDGGAYRRALNELSGAQKSSKGAPAYSRFVNRPLGRRFAAAASVVGLTPTSVTLISAAFTFSAIVVIATVEPRWWLGLVVMPLLVIGYGLDAADGQLARLTGTSSLRGEWLDHTVDAAKACVLHLAVLISWYRFYELDHLWLLIPLGYALVDSVVFAATILKDMLAARHVARTGEALALAPTPVIRSLLVLPTDYGFVCLIFLLVGLPGMFLGVYSLVFLANVAFLSLALFKWYGDLRALEA